MELLSKKELLQLTGISYGQLYRWKRHGLIPESWFQKQASPTGQETFFPRQQMISRVETILELKQTHSLDEMRAILSPHTTGARLCTAHLAQMGIVDWLIPSGADTYSFSQAIYLHLLTRAGQQGILPRHMLEELAKNGLASASHPSVAEQLLTLFRTGNSCHALFSPAGEIAFDDTVHMIAQYHMADEAEQLKPMFNKIVAQTKEE